MFLIRTFKIENNKIILGRTPGYYLTAEQCFRCINNNICDIFEDGYYNFAVIESIEPGLYQDGRDIQWFYYDKKNNMVSTVAPPHIQNYFIEIG